jgi:putative hydrolase
MSTLPPGLPLPSSLHLVSLGDHCRARKKIDYHMHTSHTDGTTSAQEMAQAAVSKGLNEILFSEHVRHTSTYFPKFASEIRSLRFTNLSARLGAETKVLDEKGTLDCSPGIEEQCDALVGSVHSSPPAVGGTWTKFTIEEAVELEFRLALAIVTKSRAHILGHPMGIVISRFQVQPIEKLVSLANACRDHGKAFELNARYCPAPSRWLELVKEAGCKVSFGSDAHRPDDVGRSWELFMNMDRQDCWS